MKQVVEIISLMLLLTGLLLSTVVSGGQVDLSVSGMGSDDGVARIVLMKGVDQYNGQQPVTLTESVRIRNGGARWRADVPAGTYVIIAHHDKDANDTLDRPVFSLPIEPYGYSNGAWTSLGLPDFDDVAFVVGDGVARQHIHLRTNAFITLAELSSVAAIAIAALFCLLALYRRYHHPEHRSC